MEKAKLIYIFDAYCSWCYGFDPVLLNIQKKYEESLDFEVISGGMIPEDTSIQKMAERFPDPEASYNRIFQLTGRKVEDNFIKMLRQPEEYEYTFNSTYPARAMVTLKHFTPQRELEQAKSIQELIYQKGLDLTKTESYKSIAEEFGIKWDAFVHRLESDTSLEEAKYEFHLARQLEVTSYPAVLIQTGDQYFYMIARGYTPFEDLNQRIQNILDQEKKKRENLS